ncbi:Cytochrome c, mono-and diheme variants [Paraburkholderia caballeronis]|uniref:Cytochrome c, mono-and diheme variants n=2 Tax=Paraburkholderia caballeronis TaxID=416943 RepID=A0A1H7VXY8_9BURK|nr:cytochrome c [Paraburkholderia caballeronis]PXW14610.1 mono/diheme cytochrome c family protein [Paraburkholderia caballeronis]PXW93438.1 mono/diheme cytochrome c family protein [Paraburkholderia caballeronis]RAJ88297.1 mono/diheme cytochrome c family protein [Paraburkholderia caballeronis]SEE20880.1 Cytochrome c, mono-and diheme variants [Paraburkholderia caballeronis]SEM14070.1 Cytochrome c, mono-and diheme variants [Paraburkholderia caballeronis]
MTMLNALEQARAAHAARPTVRGLARGFAAAAFAAVSALCASAAVAAPAPASADAALVQRGAYLAQLGDCAACHTAPHGKPFAGGLPMNSPLGTIYTTNITPDPDTGIGHYSEEDFARALREGVARDGHNLYPAMPYPSYTKVNDDDVKALYAYFLHGVEPVQQANRDTDIRWPLNMRWPLKIWNAVFLDKGVYRDKPGKDVAWNRGAYLVQGLGHCGSCHTPRGVGFNEQALDESGSAFLTGASLDGWFATNLTGEHNTGLGRWSEAELAQFLKTGANAHASAFGSMTSVINNSTQAMTDSDVNAIAAYLKSLPAAGGDGGPAYAYDPQATKASLARPANDAGARVYAAYCMHCHGVDGRGFAPMLAPLAGNPNVLGKDPVSLINVTLNGTGDLVIGGIPAPYPMPAYAGTLDDRQIADVLTFIRAGWNNRADAVNAAQVAKLRSATQSAAR